MITMKDLYVRNPRCCECGATSPRWASINLGVLFCMDCSGIHRQMGTHISKVKSCTLDNWQQDWLQLIYNVGNDISNAYYEYSLPQEYMIDSKSLKHYVVSRMREKIFNKYDKRKWTPPFREGPVELYLKGGVPTDCLPQSENSNSNVKAAAPVVVPQPSKPAVEVNQKTGTNTAPALAAERKQNIKVNLLDCPTIDQVNTAKTIAAVEDVKRASVEPDIMGFSQPTYPSVPLANHTYDKLNDLLNDLEASPSSNHHQQQQRVTVPLVKTSTASNKSKPKDPFLSLLD